MAGRAGTIVRRLLRTQVQCVLATVDPSTRAPATHLMAFGAASDMSRIFLATADQSRKARNMRRSPSVSILWDDRTGRLADHKDGALCAANGTASQLSATAAEDARRIILDANPNFSDFLASPTVALFAVDVESYEVVVGYGAPEQWRPRP